MSTRLTGTDFLWNKDDVCLTVVNNRGGFIAIGSGCEEYKNSDDYLSENYPDAQEIVDSTELQAIMNDRYEVYMGLK